MHSFNVIYRSWPEKFSSYNVFGRIRVILPSVLDIVRYLGGFLTTTVLKLGLFSPSDGQEKTAAMNIGNLVTSQNPQRTEIY